jgi:hypothetical protein
MRTWFANAAAHADPKQKMSHIFQILAIVALRKDTGPVQQ